MPFFLRESGSSGTELNNHERQNSTGTKLQVYLRDKSFNNLATVASTAGICRHDQRPRSILWLD